MDRREYNRCVDHFSDPIYRFILKSCKNKTLAEDIVQESFLSLWESVEEIAFEKAKAFLFTTSYRKMIDCFRKEKRNSDFEQVNPNEHLHFSYEHDLQDILEMALEKLPEIQKNLILLRDYENYSYKEIADITNLTESQVKVYIFRGRKSMKEFIRRPELII